MARSVTFSPGSSVYLKEARKREKERLGRRETKTTCMKDPANILEVQDLSTSFFTRGGIVRAVDGISFDVPRNSIVAVVGESGCGKSVTALSLLELLPRPSGQIVGGEIRFSQDGKEAIDIAKAPTKVLETIRGKGIAMIFQEPMSSLNPVYRIGHQIDEAALLHDGRLHRKDAKARTLELLGKVGIPDAGRVYDMYPQALSGGMRQRVMIAMALASQPRLIIADEPTTALDVTIQAQILELLKNLKEETGVSLLLITHDLGVVKDMAQEVVVMYAGRIVEKGTAEEVLRRPSHPYTQALLAARPRRGDHTELKTIPGTLPDPLALPEGCYFAPRCSRCTMECSTSCPAYVELSETHLVACFCCREEA